MRSGKPFDFPHFHVIYLTTPNALAAFGMGLALSLSVERGELTCA
jgi:hypothetical protein